MDANSMTTRSFNIGEAAHHSGVSARMIRHYEAVGLISKANRTLSNYRTYTEKDIHTLRFIRQARNLGFVIEKIAVLLSLWQDRRRPSRKVKELANLHIRELDVRILELTDMKRTLELLVENCHGDDRPNCPILAAIEQAPSLPPRVPSQPSKGGNKRSIRSRPSRAPV